MKKKLLKFVCAFLFLLPVCANATNITFTSNGTISGTDSYDTVYVRNDLTTVEFSGGTVQLLFTYDTVTVNQTGGTITNNLQTGDNSTYNLYHGNVTGLQFVVYGFSTANILGGNINTNTLKTSSGSVLNIKGGNLNFTLVDNHGTVNIYGYDFNYNPTTFNLTGKLADNSPFSFNFGNPSYYAQPTLIVVPEPVSLCLLAVGGLFLRRKF